jgi:predicted transposase YdaD
MPDRVVAILGNRDLEKSRTDLTLIAPYIAPWQSRRRPPWYARGVHYDLTLKALFHGLPVRLLELLTGHRAEEILTVEFPSVTKRQPDLVLRLDDGRVYHLELQSAGDAEMPWRMLEYYSLIRRHWQAPVLQQVLYVGQGPNTLADTLAVDRLNFSYGVINIRDIDCRHLLASPSLEDNLLALLCGLHDERQAVRAVLGKIAGLGENQRRDALERLEILCGLRPLKAAIQGEVKRMPITLNLKENPFFQEAFAEGEERGRQQGVAEGEHRLLSKQLGLRFGPLPEAVMERLRAADSDQLERWGVRLLTVQSLDEVFGEGE